MSKKKKEKPLKTNAPFEDALKFLVTSEDHKKRILKRQQIIKEVHDIFICEKHGKRIFNCTVDPKTLEIYYETCCKEFSDKIFTEVYNRSLLNRELK